MGVEIKAPSPFIEPRPSDSRLTGRNWHMLIDGKDVGAASGKTISRDSPAYAHATVATYALADSADVGGAITAARRAFDEGRWPRMRGAERARILSKVAELIAAHAEELATIECVEIGKPISVARGEAAYAADLWSFAAGAARGLAGETQNDLGAATLGLVLREPLGVVGIITPWNFPLVIASERLAWALGAGCTVVVKPSEFCSGSTIRLAQLAREAGLPDGVFNVVTGLGDPAGETLARHPGTDMLSFTGSVRVGRIVGGLAGERTKRVGLELGGKGPQIVFADADLIAAADRIARSIFRHAGQACIAGSRLIVEASVADELIARIADLAYQVVTGDPLDERTEVGSLIHADHRSKVERYVEAGRDAGAELMFGGTRLGTTGCYYAPTLFTGVRSDMSIWREEIFGPVLSAMTFRDADEAVRLANDTDFGLSGSVWTRDLGTALATVRRMSAGRTWINTSGDGAAEMPIAAFKQSGIGRELGRSGFDEYSRFKSTIVALGEISRWSAGSVRPT